MEKGIARTHRWSPRGNSGSNLPDYFTQKCECGVHRVKQPGWPNRQPFRYYQDGKSYDVPIGCSRVIDRYPGSIAAMKEKDMEYMKRTGMIDGRLGEIRQITGQPGQKVRDIIGARPPKNPWAQRANA